MAKDFFIYLELINSFTFNLRFKFFNIIPFLSQQSLFLLPACFYLTINARSVRLISRRSPNVIVLARIRKVPPQSSPIRLDRPWPDGFGAPIRTPITRILFPLELLFSWYRSPVTSQRLGMGKASLASSQRWGEKRKGTTAKPHWGKISMRESKRVWVVFP